ncbi:Uncharacterised protein [Candidatus Gugararchaeum adminiculabundum]|nr:Uncharacterised protein [Candidatus Gugararchaeum adminiculabundum]
MIFYLLVFPIFSNVRFIFPSALTLIREIIKLIFSSNFSEGFSPTK